jgi:glycosyltransferase involved in cell wall biosynthesis
MSFLEQVAVLILTRNEQDNIARTLHALSRFPEILVLDSGSDDSTRDIILATPNARLATRSFDAHAAQWNHGLSLLNDKRPWALALDADYVLTDEIVDEIAALSPDVAISGYRASFRYCIDGKPLRASLYPPAIVLFRRTRAVYVQQGHTQRLQLDGAVLPITASLLHDDRKPLSRWLEAQRRYAQLEVDHLLSTPSQDLRRMDRLRLKAWIMPLLVLPYTLLVKRCLFDGWRGRFYGLQRLVAETMICLAILERRFDKARPQRRMVNRDAGSE